MGVTDESQIGPGLAGFITMFLLALAVIVLVRSMSGHLRKVRYSPDPSAPPDPSAEPAPGEARPSLDGDTSPDDDTRMDDDTRADGDVSGPGR